MTEDYFAGDPRSHRERMLAGDWYRGGDPESSRIAESAALLGEAYRQAYLVEPERARSLLKDMLGSLGEGSTIRPPLYVDYGENLHLGDGVYINFGLVALDVVEIRIGNKCQIGPNVQLLTPVHPIDPEMRAAYLEAAKPIVLEDNVWLGGGVIVLPGVTIGKNSVVGAGSVVTRDVPPNCVVVGNPAHVIRQDI